MSCRSRQSLQQNLPLSRVCASGERSCMTFAWRKSGLSVFSRSKIPLIPHHCEHSMFLKPYYHISKNSLSVKHCVNIINNLKERHLTKCSFHMELCKLAKCRAIILVSPSQLHENCTNIIRCIWLILDEYNGS